jgi:hypothetical protein
MKESPGRIAGAVAHFNIGAALQCGLTGGKKSS